MEVKLNFTLKVNYQLNVIVTFRFHFLLATWNRKFLFHQFIIDTNNIILKNVQ